MLSFLFLGGGDGGGGVVEGGFFSPQADEDNRENNESSRTSLYGLHGFDRERQSRLYGVPVRTAQQRLQA